MSRNKKQTKENTVTTEKNPALQFIFTAGKINIENLKNLDESIKRLKKEYQGLFSVVILDSAKAHVEKLIDGNLKNTGFLNAPAITILNQSSLIEKNKNTLLKNELSIWLPLEGLIRPVNLNEFFRIEEHFLSENEYYQITWDDEKSSMSKGYIISRKVTDFILTETASSGYYEFSQFERILRQCIPEKKNISLNHPSPYSSKFIPSRLRLNPVPAFRRFINWNITGFFNGPVQSKSSSLFTNQSLYRLLFFTVAFFVMTILPIISYNAGISGDEEKHYAQAGKVYNYFATDGKDTTSLNDEKYKLNYYGQSFDLLTYVFIKKFHIEKIYETRHVMNGILGALAILCSGLLARILFGNIAGIFTMILLFFSPGYIGHAMNNPLDIPFAFGYIFTLLQLVRFLKRLPELNYRIAFLITLGISFTISIRIGGLLLIPYIFMFSGLYLLLAPMPWKIFSKHWLNLAGKGILILTGISLIAYFTSLLPWPYARQNPLKNPFEAMKMMENISVALRVLFEGKIFWSDNLPASYIPKNILLSVPLLILAGFASAIIFLREKKYTFWIFFLLFVVIFPVVYIIYKESNVYGAWRHLLFIYPPMVILAGLSMQSLVNSSKNRFVKFGIVLLIVAAMFKPAAHIVRNYPFQYIYFNEIAGGVEKAYKKYETDYYMVSLKPGTDWIKKNILKGSGADSANPIRIVSNAPADIMNYYFRDFKKKVKLPYTRYYDRGLYDWDYAIFFCNYIDPYQINHNIWPPKNTIYNVTIDGVKICAIVKRENKDDFRGYELMNKALKTRSKADLDESILLMENAVLYDKYNEIAYLNLAQAYILKEEFETARKKLNILLSFYPNYEKALNLIGYAYLNEGEIKKDKVKIERAISIFNEVIKINYKFAGAYHNLGLASMVKGEYDKAFGYFQKSIDNNPSSKDSYNMMAIILEKRGDSKQARQVREFASRL